MNRLVKSALGIPEGLFTKENIPGLCLGYLCMSMGFAINHGDTTLFNTTTQHIFALSQYLIAIYSIIKARSFQIRNKGIFIALFCYWLVYLLYKAPGVQTGFGSQLIFFLIYVSCTEKKYWLVGIKFFCFLFYVICLLGLISYFSFVFNLGLPYEMVSYYGTNELKSLYVNYHFSTILLDASDGMRLCGLFNEPGHLGTIAVFVLVLNKFKLNFQNIVILIASALSFSLAFIVLVILYWGMRAMTEGRKAPIIIVVAYVLFNVVAPSIKVEDPNLEILLNRLTITDDSKLQGDNRNDDSFEMLYNKTLDNPTTALFGHGMGYTAQVKLMGISYKQWIVELGLVGFFFFFGMFFFLGLKNSKDINNRYVTLALIYIVLFFASSYQRPYIYSFDYVLILFGGIYSIVNDENKKLLLRNQNV